MNIFRKLSDFVAVLVSAGRTAAAVEGNRPPHPGDLARLGISAVAFGAINKA